ncbi:exopolysaccharide biosynthesis protein VpsJ [soil metagenome]
MLIDHIQRTTDNGQLINVFESLAAWCRARAYAGYDPFDALNSRLFQATPLKRSRVARLAWTQVFKRSPLSWRALASVPAGRNPKGTALFALAWLARWRTVQSEEAKAEARALLDNLLAAQIKTPGGATCWGYNFDWQGRAFYAPRGTPTVVPTAFAARALVEAARAFGDERYLRAARGACEFILRDLNRSEETADEVCFSYSPLDRTRVFNASLLAAETLASVGTLTNEDELKAVAQRAANYVVRRQHADGSWAYGAAEFQTWADNFHTAFVLTSLARIIAAGVDDAGELEKSLRRGYGFWREGFFLADGWPKYYHDRQFPADAHAASAAIVCLIELQEIDERALALADKIARWSVRHLRDPRGFFYYQRRRFYTVRTPYMRWAQAWMLYALARLLEVSSKQ